MLYCQNKTTLTWYSNFSCKCQRSDLSWHRSGAGCRWTNWLTDLPPNQPTPRVFLHPSYLWGLTDWTIRSSSCSTLTFDRLFFVVWRNADGWRARRPAELNTRLRAAARREGVKVDGGAYGERRDNMLTLWPRLISRGSGRGQEGRGASTLKQSYPKVRL